METEMTDTINWPHHCGNCDANQNWEEVWEHLTPKPEEGADFIFLSLTFDGRPDVNVDIFRCKSCGHIRLMARQPGTKDDG